MAEKRMFTKKVTDSDAFIEMASSTQALYFHLNQGADDDGFNNQVQNAMFKAHASVDDLKVLFSKNFLLRFESGVVVIKHWWMHNTLRKDRYTPTNFQEELSMLGIKDNNAYTLNKEEMARLPFGCQMVAIDKNREDKISIDKSNLNNKELTNIHTCVRELFETIKKNLEEEIPPITYATFFENLEVEGVEDNYLILSAMGLTRDAIDDNYKGKVNKAIVSASKGALIGYRWKE